MGNISTLNGCFILGCVLSFMCQIRCMEQEKEMHPQEIKKLVKLFFVNLYWKNLILERFHNKKNEYRVYALRSKEEFERKLLQEFPVFQEMKEKSPQEYQKYFQEQYNSCIDARTFDQSWEYTVMDRSPVSFKLQVAEENTAEIFEQIVRSYGLRYGQILYHLLMGQTNNEYLKEIYKEALMDFMYESSRSLCQYEIIMRAYERKLESKEISTPVRLKIKQEQEIEQRKYASLLKDDFYKAMFFINQVPELRKQIFEYRGQDDIVKKFLDGLKKTEYSCHSPDQESKTIQRREFLGVNSVSQEVQSPEGHLQRNFLVV